MAEPRGGQQARAEQLGEADAVQVGYFHVVRIVHDEQRGIDVADEGGDVEALDRRSDPPLERTHHWWLRTRGKRDQLAELAENFGHRGWRADDDEAIHRQPARRGEQRREATERVGDDGGERADRFTRCLHRLRELGPRGRGAGGIAVRRAVESDYAVARRDERIDEGAELRAS